MLSRPCNPRSMHKPKRSNAGYPKVFLGGLPANVTESDLRAFFVRYGQVMEVVIMYDQEKKKSRGFGFLSVSHLGLFTLNTLIMNIVNLRH